MPSDYSVSLRVAVLLIKAAKPTSTICPRDEIRQYRGTLTEPGKNSPYRDRTVEENLELFEACGPAIFPTAPSAARQN